jgi:uncharacterized protein with PQ loop repeat
MLALFLAGMTCWLLYGIARGSLPIILANGMTALQVLMILALKLSGVRRRKEVK